MDTREHVTTSYPKIEQQRRERESTDLLSNLVLGFFKRPTLRKVMHASIRTALASWSGTRPLRQRIAERLLKVAMHALPIVSPSPSSAGARDVGRLVTLKAQTANTNLAENPASLADHLEGPLCDFIKGTDFGEVKELIDRAEDPIVETVRRVMDFVWNTYPAKLGAVMSMVHPISNITVRSLKEIIMPLNGVSPDLMADLILAILGSINGREIGQLTNSLMEMARQIHTGSLLQGESGVPQFQMDLTNKLRDILSGIDPKLLGKMQIIAAENAEERANARSAIMEENPALVLAALARLSALKNPRIRALKRRVQVFEDQPQDGLAEAVTEGLTELDTQTLAEIFNTSLNMFNQVHEEKPDFFKRLMEDFFMNIDTQALKDATQWLKQDVINGLRPIAREVLPVLIEGLSELNQD
jgi:hypothetical protein